MNDLTIEEGNKLIAGFMGLEFDCMKNDSSKFYKKSNRDGWTSRTYFNPKYHTSWDWLMPVVEKVEGLGYDIAIEGIWQNDKSLLQSCYIAQGEEIVHITNTNKIVAVRSSIIQFIQWYNKNSKL